MIKRLPPAAVVRMRSPFSRHSGQRRRFRHTSILTGGHTRPTGCVDLSYMSLLNWLLIIIGFSYLSDRGSVWPAE